MRKKRTEKRSLLELKRQNAAAFFGEFVGVYKRRGLYRNVYRDKNGRTHVGRGRWTTRRGALLLSCWGQR